VVASAPKPDLPGLIVSWQGRYSYHRRHRGARSHTRRSPRARRKLSCSAVSGDIRTLAATNLANESFGAALAETTRDADVQVWIQRFSAAFDSAARRVLANMHRRRPSRCCRRSRFRYVSAHQRVHHRRGCRCASMSIGIGTGPLLPYAQA
jgi:hypothetical protein